MSHHKTEKNLAEAFAGESQANRKYLAFAKKADEEGYPMAAKLFRAAADAETVHALLVLHDSLRPDAADAAAISRITIDRRFLIEEDIAEGEKDRVRLRNTLSDVDLEIVDAETNRRAQPAPRCGPPADPVQERAHDVEVEAVALLCDCEADHEDCGCNCA